MSTDTRQIEQTLEQDRDHLRQTLGALEQKMSPGRMLDEAMAYFNTGPKEFASGLAGQVQNNPLPVLVTGVGLAWLIWSDRKGKGGSSSAQAATSVPTTDSYGVEDSVAFTDEDYRAWEAHDQLQQAEWACVPSADETPDLYEERLYLTRAEALRLRPMEGEDHASFRSRVSSTVQGVKGRGAGARDKFKRAASSARSGIGAAAGSAKSGLGSAASATKSGVSSAASSAAQLHETNPFATAAIGMAIGALLGAAAPLTRKEQETLGSVADKGLALGAQGARKAADAVSNATSGGGSDGGSRQPPGDETQSPTALI